jgi:hypothetical protein
MSCMRPSVYDEPHLLDLLFDLVCLSICLSVGVIMSGCIANDGHSRRSSSLHSHADLIRMPLPGCSPVGSLYNIRSVENLNRHFKREPEKITTRQD